MVFDVLMANQRKTRGSAKDAQAALAQKPAVEPVRWRATGLAAIGGEVPAITKPAFEKFGFHAVELIVHWPTIAGQSLASYTAPKRIKWPRMPDAAAFEANASGNADAQAAAKKGERTSLQIWVDGGRAHEVPYLKAAIIERINQYFGYKAITDVEPVPGPVARQMQVRIAPKAPPAAQSSSQSQLDRALAEMAHLRAERQKRLNNKP